MKKKNTLDPMETNGKPEVWPVMLTIFKEDGAIDETGTEKLVDWYLANHVDGIFAVCLSSEMFALNPVERRRLATLTAARAAGRVPVVACGGFGRSMAERREDILRMADTGVAAVVLPVSAIFSAAAEDDAVTDGILGLIGQCPGIDFGVYECPMPYKRCLSPDMLRNLLANTSRLMFAKDTCCDLRLLAAKAQAVVGHGMRLLNAHLPTLLASVRHGCSGYCGIAANVVPLALVRMLACLASNPEKAEQLQAMLNVLEPFMTLHYPNNAKNLLRIYGLPVTDFSRTCLDRCTAEEVERLKDFRTFFSLWQKNDFHFVS